MEHPPADLVTVGQMDILCLSALSVSDNAILILCLDPSDARKMVTSTMVMNLGWVVVSLAFGVGVAIEGQSSTYIDDVKLNM
mmetsp:Transcript_5070/g.5921  ORF Transcript_5070/g.5921 Transcript_5070/m.5921 type:complete len:82 (+) Transcript_5070:927-1172(+)